MLQVLNMILPYLHQFYTLHICTPMRIIAILHIIKKYIDAKMPYGAFNMVLYGDMGFEESSAPLSSRATSMLEVRKRSHKQGTGRHQFLQQKQPLKRLRKVQLLTPPGLMT